MDRLKETLDAGENKFNGQTELKQYFLQGRAKRIQLNEQTRLDLNEAQQESKAISLTCPPSLMAAF